MTTNAIRFILETEKYVAWLPLFGRFWKYVDNRPKVVSKSNTSSCESQIPSCERNMMFNWLIFWAFFISEEFNLFGSQSSGGRCEPVRTDVKSMNLCGFFVHETTLGQPCENLVEAPEAFFKWWENRHHISSPKKTSTKTAAAAFSALFGSKMNRFFESSVTQGISHSSKVSLPVLQCRDRFNVRFLATTFASAFRLWMKPTVAPGGQTVAEQDFEWLLNDCNWNVLFQQKYETRSSCGRVRVIHWRTWHMVSGRRIVL